MKRSDLLSEFAFGLTHTAEAFKKTGTLTKEEFQQIHSLLWGFVVKVKDAEESERLAEQTAEAL
jgi:hypothetical protein